MRDPQDACDWIDEIRALVSMYEEGVSTEAEFNNRLNSVISPPWIPTKNNQPQEGQYVLVHISRSEPEISVAQYLKDSEGNFSFLVVGGYWYEATDWMFLPKPPKEGYV